MSFQRVLTAQVFANFASAKANCRHELEWANRAGDTDRHGQPRGGNDWTVACEGNVLYSFDHSYTLAVRLTKPDGSFFFVRNGDPFSLTTAMHQSKTQQACQPGITVSFTALWAAGIYPTGQNRDPWKRANLTYDMIVDVCEDESTSVFRTPDGKFFHCTWSIVHVHKPFEEPQSGMFIASSSQPPHPVASDPDGTWPKSDEERDRREMTGTYGFWHRMGGLLLRDGDRYLICGVDEGNAFVSQLPGPAGTIEEAFELLKPDAVREAEAHNIPVKRQGEWFFVRSGLTSQEVQRNLGVTSQKAFRQAIAERPLPFRTKESNRHVCRQYQNGSLYVTGRVRHTDTMGAPSGEHRTLKLEEGWWLAYRNTEEEGWSISPGQFGNTRARFD